MVRAAPPGTWVKDASLSECEAATRSSSPASRAAPLIWPNANVTWAEPAVSARPRWNPASR